MLAGWIVAGLAAAGILGTLLRISYLLGQLVQRFDLHIETEGKIVEDHEKRLRSIERHRPATN